MNNDYSFGNKIYDIRKKKGFTQQDIALELGVSDKAVSKWENGTSKPTINNLKKLCNLLDISFDDLVSKEENKTNVEITKVVITGGPGAAKHDGIECIKNYFEKEGYKVLIVPAVARNLHKYGLKVGDYKNFVNFQKTILKLQVQLEEEVEEQIKYLNTNKVLIICDRGVMDCKAWCSSKEFNKILIDLNLKPESLMNSYDIVFHLSTCAKGFPSLYQGECSDREENVDEAITIDNKVLKAWADHPNVRVINSYYHLEDKMDRLIKELKFYLRSYNNNYYEKRYLIKLPDIKDLEKLFSYSKVNLSITYLNNNGIDKVIRRQINNYSCYYMVKKDDEGTITTRISPRKYIEELDNSDKSRNRLDKIRHSFIYKGHSFILDSYDFYEDKAILEVSLLSPREDVELPKFIQVIKEVTDDVKYKNNYFSLKDKE